MTVFSNVLSTNLHKVLQGAKAKYHQLFINRIQVTQGGNAHRPVEAANGPLKGTVRRNDATNQVGNLGLFHLESREPIFDRSKSNNLHDRLTEK